MPAVIYTPSLTDLTHPQITDPPELSYEEIMLIKQYVNNVVMPALVAGIVPPTLSGFSYQGAYSASHQYYANNIISDFGAVYIATGSTIGHAPTAGASNSYWTLVIPANSALTTEGDLLYYQGGANSRLPIGAVGSVLTVVGSDPAWSLNDTITGFSPLNANNGATQQFGLSNPNTTGNIRAVGRSYSNGFHVWLNQENEVCFRGTAGSYYFSGNNGTGVVSGTIILNNFSAANGLLQSYGVGGANEYFIQVHAAWTSILALTNLGNVFAIGANTNGICGDGTTVEKRLWVKIPTLGTAALWSGTAAIIAKLHVGIGTGGAGTEAGDPCSIFAIDTTGRLFAWGSNALGQLGVGSTTSPISSPTLVSGPWGTVKVSKIHASGVHSLVVDANGQLYGTGYNGTGANTYGGVLGLGNNTNQTSFVNITGSIGGGVTQILASADNGATGAGYYAASYVVANGNIWTTGYNADGRLGNGSTTMANAWQQITTDTYNQSLYIMGEGQYSTLLALNTSAAANQITVWGYNAEGQCGQGTTTNVLTPTAPSSNSQFSFTTNAVNGVINTTIQYFNSTNSIYNIFPIHGLGGSGTHGALLFELSAGLWWYLGPQGSLNLTPIAEATTNYAQIFPMPLNIATAKDTITDASCEGQVLSSLGSFVIQCASGKQYAIGSNTTRQYNDNGLYLAQFATINL